MASLFNMDMIQGPLKLIVNALGLKPDFVESAVNDALAKIEDIRLALQEQNALARDSNMRLRRVEAALGISMEQTASTLDVKEIGHENGNGHDRSNDLSAGS